MLSLDLTDGELKQLVIAVERSYNDAIYYSRYWEEHYSKSLVKKIANAIAEEQQTKEALEQLKNGDFSEELF